MKNCNKKFISLFLVLVICISAVAAPAFADTETNRTAYTDYDHSYDEAMAEGIHSRVNDFFDDKYGPDMNMSNFAVRLSYVYFTHSDCVGIRNISTKYYYPSYATRNLLVDYVDDYDAYLERLQQVRNEVDALMPENPTELEIVHICHDYLVATSSYNVPAGKGTVTDYSVFYACGVFKDHSAVCRGISHAYKYLLDYYGIDNAIAESAAYNHVWNLVRLDGQWYHVDITADETAGYDVLGRVSHDYFLISTETLLERNSTKSDFTVLYKDLDLVFTDSACATDKQYESGQPWSNSYSVCHYYNGHLYTIGRDSVLYKDGKFFFQPNEHMSWHPFGNQYAVYTNAIVTAKLTAIGKDLYMNSPRNIYHVNLDTGAAEIVYSPEEVAGWTDPDSGEVYLGQDQIFGLNRMEGKLYISIEKDLPTEQETWTYVPGFDVAYGGESAAVNVSYDANGGNGQPGTQTAAAGTAITLGSEIPTRDGYVFLGWADSQSATDAQYKPGDSYTAATDITLYAVWRQYGDVTLNGSINIEDVYVLRKSSAGLIELTEEQNAVADVYADGRYNSLDVNILRRYVAELVTQIPYNAQ